MWRIKTNDSRCFSLIIVRWSCTKNVEIVMVDQNNLNKTSLNLLGLNELIMTEEYLSTFAIFLIQN